MARLDTTEKGRRRGVGVALRTRIELWLAVVFMALSFAAGFTIRAMSEPPTPQGPVAELAPAPLPPIFAPPLTDEQLQQELPAGHPDIPAAGPGQDGSSAVTDGGTGGTGPDAGQ